MLLVLLNLTEVHMSLVEMVSHFELLLMKHIFHLSITYSKANSFPPLRCERLYYREKAIFHYFVSTLKNWYKFCHWKNQAIVFGITGPGLQDSFNQLGLDLYYF